MPVIRKLFATIVLLSGILLSIVVTPVFLTTVGIIVAVFALYSKNSKVKTYALEIWMGFDKFANASRGGTHKETVSSCLGKSVYYQHPPVFKHITIDRLVAKLLGIVDYNHCYKSIDWSVGRGKVYNGRAS